MLKRYNAFHSGKEVLVSLMKMMTSLTMVVGVIRAHKAHKYLASQMSRIGNSKKGRIISLTNLT